MTLLDPIQALEQIAYPKNWPASVFHGKHVVPDDLINWMQATAAKALTGSYHSDGEDEPADPYERAEQEGMLGAECVD